MPAFLRALAHVDIAIPIAAPAVRTTTLTSGAFDIGVYDGTVAALVNSSAGGAGNTLDGKFQESADGIASWTDISGAAFLQIGNLASSQALKIDASAVKQFVRFVGTVGGGSPSFNYGVQLIGFKKQT